MLSREVTTLECVHHPNILRLFEVVETLGRVHLVTEWIRGGELYNRITQGGPLTESHAAPLYKQLLLAVKHMHSLGFVHRDIKAENVLMVTEDRIKLADFGFSTQLINGAQQHLDTFCGSPPYAAPELFSDDHYIGGPVDVWALGVLVYFMIVGNMPFRAPTVPALRTAVLSGDFSLPSHLSLPCIRLIQRILVHTPSRRPTIDQLIASQWVNHNHLPIDITQPKQQKKSWFSRRRKLTHERHIEMSNLAPIQCSTKRASSIYAENFLNPIDMPNIEELTISQPNVTKSHRRSIFSGTLKKKIGPMEDGGEKGNMFNRKNSLEIKTVESDLLNGTNGPRRKPSTDCNNPFDEEQGNFIMAPTFTDDLTHLHHLEVEARLLLGKLGLTSDILCRSIDNGPRSEVIGIYRIVIHRLQKQMWQTRQAEIIANEEVTRPKSNRTCAIL
ncbi:hypothetical protein HA402_009413 [Bradysia odoriphaga]|nr:hypothetical protein HA402_009413 [Bradysia odoriphaga]